MHFRRCRPQPPRRDTRHRRKRRLQRKDAKQGHKQTARHFGWKSNIPVIEWAKTDKDHIQSVQLLATTENRTGMLAGITNAIADIKTGIRDARANVSKDDIGLIEVTVEVFDKKHLDKVVGAIEHVPGVIAVERINA